MQLRMSLRSWFLLFSCLFAPLTIWLFGWPLGILLAFVSGAIFWSVAIVALVFWGGRGGRNPWQ